MFMGYGVGIDAEAEAEVEAERFDGGGVRDAVVLGGPRDIS